MISMVRLDDKCTGYTFVIFNLCSTLPSPLPKETATQIYCIFKSIILKAIQLHC